MTFQQVLENLARALRSVREEDLTSSQEMDVFLPLWQVAPYRLAVLMEACGRVQSLPSGMLLEVFKGFVSSLLHKDICVEWADADYTLRSRSLGSSLCVSDQLYVPASWPPEAARLVFAVGLQAMCNQCLSCGHVTCNLCLSCGHVTCKQCLSCGHGTCNQSLSWSADTPQAFNVSEQRFSF